MNRRRWICPLVAFCWCVPLSAVETPPPNINNYEVIVQVREDAAVLVNERITLGNSQSPIPIEGTLPLYRGDQLGHHWKIEYSDIQMAVDGQRVQFQSLSDESPLLKTVQPVSSGSRADHLLELDYVMGNDIRSRDDMEQLDLSFGRHHRVQSLIATFQIPSGLAPEKAGLRASTEYSATTSSCACDIAREAGRIVVKTNRVLGPSESLDLTLSLEGGHFRRTLTSNWSMLLEQQSTLAAWGIFIAAILVYGLLSSLLVYIVLPLRRGQIGARKKALIQALLMSGLSLCTLTILSRPEVAMPGVLGGMFISMTFPGSTSHGPGSRFLWVPFAFLINSVFYYIVLRLLQAVGVCRFWSRPIRDNIRK